MKLSFVLNTKLLFVASLFHYGSQVDAACNADNCLRAMWPTASPSQLSSARAFCATYTLQSPAATTGFPTRATSACGTNQARYSSACSCMPTTTPDPCASSGAIVKDGGFECGISPWVPAAVGGTTYSITRPGHTGNFAFEVDQNIDTIPSMQEQASINQNITLVPGRNYTLTFYTWFNNGDAGFIGVKFNGIPKWTVDARDNNGPNVWNVNSFPFIASTEIFNLRFEFIFGSRGSVDRIDDITVVPA